MVQRSGIDTIKYHTKKHVFDLLYFILVVKCSVYLSYGSPVLQYFC